MSRKNVTFREQPEGLIHISSLPQSIKLKNITNQSQANEIVALRLRIDELESKVSQLQAKIRTKRKRIRRKSSQVEKRHKCEFCKKLYGSLVSLNLHLRIKHRREKLDKDKNKSTQMKRQLEQSQV